MQGSLTINVNMFLFNKFTNYIFIERLSFIFDMVTKRMSVPLNLTRFMLQRKKWSGQIR